MKIVLLIIFLSTTFVVCGQDSLLNKAWTKLTTQFKNRIQVADKFGTFVLASKSVDTPTVSYLREMSISLTKKLNEAIIPSKASIDSIKAENLLFTRALSKILVLLEYDRDFRMRNDFKSYQTLLMSAENKIVVARKEFNEACKAVMRDDIMY
jgi:hypothetical protein